jgi:hypothetical protein
LPDFTGKKCEKSKLEILSGSSRILKRHNLKLSDLEINEAIERNPIKFEGNTFLKFINSVGKR